MLSLSDEEEEIPVPDPRSQLSSQIHGEILYELFVISSTALLTIINCYKMRVFFFRKWWWRAALRSWGEARIWHEPLPLFGKFLWIFLHAHFTKSLLSLNFVGRESHLPSVCCYEAFVSSISIPKGIYFALSRSFYIYNLQVLSASTFMISAGLTRVKFISKLFVHFIRFSSHMCGGMLLLLFENWNSDC